MVGKKLNFQILSKTTLNHPKKHEKTPSTTWFYLSFKLPVCRSEKVAGWPTRQLMHACSLTYEDSRPYSLPCSRKQYLLYTTLSLRFFSLQYAITEPCSTSGHEKKSTILYMSIVVSSRVMAMWVVLWDVKLGEGLVCCAERYQAGCGLDVVLARALKRPRHTKGFYQSLRQCKVLKSGHLLHGDAASGGSGSKEFLHFRWGWMYAECSP